MTQIKKFAWSGSSVAIAALLAMVMLLAAPAGIANATVTAPIGAAPVMAAGLTETWTVAYTESGVVAITTATLTFPSAFTVPQGTISGATATGAAACTGVSATGSGQVVSFTMTACATVAAGTNNLVVPGVKNPTTAGATATGFKVTTSVDATGATGAAVNIWDLSVTKSPSSVSADGASSVTFTLTPTFTATNTAITGQLTVSIDNGTIQSGTAGTLALFAFTVATDGKTASGVTNSPVATTTGATIVVKAPSTVSTGTLQVKVTPAGGGQAVLVGITTVSFTAPAVVPGAPTSASVTPTAATNVTTTGTSPNIVATWVDANGNAPIPGGTLTVNTTLGVLTAGTGVTTCTNQSCTGTLASNGQATVTLTGGGVAGTATITFTTGGISVTKTVVITGAVGTLTAVVRSDADGAGTGTTMTAAATPGATTFGAGAGVQIQVDPKDTAGNRVPSVSPVITVTPSGCVAIGATTASTATAAATTVLTAGNGAVGATCTLTATSGTKTATATLTIGAALASTSTLEIGAVDMSTVATQTVTVTVKSSTSAAVQDGTSVTLVVSAGAVANASAVLTIDGVATFTYVSPGTAQQVNLTAVAGSVTASKAIGVGVVTTPAPTGDGTLDREVPNVGVNTAVYNGGTVEQLTAAVTNAGGISVTVFIKGFSRILIPGAPAFVNASFNAAFPGGTIPAGTIVLIAVK